jgi:hypothetical protein
MDHFTTWLTTDTSCLDQGCADLLAFADELRGEPGDPDPWLPTGDPLLYTVTTVDAADGDPAAAREEAELLLSRSGWTLDGEWSAVPTGYIATVTRAAVS